MDHQTKIELGKLFEILAAINTNLGRIADSLEPKKKVTEIDIPSNTNKSNFGMIRIHGGVSTIPGTFEYHGSEK